MILDTLPTPSEFYATYWNKKPFIVRGAVPSSAFDGFIDADHLAGLAMEEDVKSRVVVTSSEGGHWECQHGPFAAEDFSTFGDSHWGLLVQNVEQYHMPTADLLQHFQFSPRWLMDDIMVSYSTAGGSVGPHTDSYHVFLVQGMGKREWKVSYDAVQEEACIEGLDLKVLKDDFAGESVVVEMGDVIYIPPHFAHSGVTIEEAMTFSVGFLGPKLSELMIEYGHYLEQLEARDLRYSGAQLDETCSGFTLEAGALKRVRDDLVGAVQSDDFARWMAEYFSTPTYCDVEDIPARDDVLSAAELESAIAGGQVLYRPEAVKVSITPASDGQFYLAVLGQSFVVSAELAEALNTGADVNAVEEIDVLVALYNLEALDFR